MIISCMKPDRLRNPSQSFAFNAASRFDCNRTSAFCTLVTSYVSSRSERTRCTTAHYSRDMLGCSRCRKTLRNSDSECIRSFLCVCAFHSQSSTILYRRAVHVVLFSGKNLVCRCTLSTHTQLHNIRINRSRARFITQILPRARSLVISLCLCCSVLCAYFSFLIHSQHTRRALPFPKCNAERTRVTSFHFRGVGALFSPRHHFHSTHASGCCIGE